MNKFILFLSLFLILSSSQYLRADDDCSKLYLEAQLYLKGNNNKALSPMDLDKLTPEHYKAYFDTEYKKVATSIDKIIASKTKPSFKNTILKLELITTELERAAYPIFQLKATMNTAAINKITNEMSGHFTDLSSKINYSKVLFEKVSTVKNSSEYQTLSTIDKQLVNNHYKSFLNNGINLSVVDQARLVEISKRGTEISTQYMVNISKSEKTRNLLIEDADELDGLTIPMLLAAEAAAKKSGKTGYLFQAQGSSAKAYIAYAKNSNTRKKLYRLTSNIASRGKFSNEGIIRELLALRHEYANILGFEDYASYSASKKMAKTKKNIADHLESILDRTKTVAKKNDMKFTAFLRKMGVDKKTLKPWDYSYYGRLYDTEMLSLSSESTKPFFELENTLDGIFNLVNDLYQVEFRSVDIATYHPDVKTYLVVDKKTKKELGLFYLDLYARSGKRGGAWMTSMRQQSNISGNEIRPHIVNVLNIAKPIDGDKTLLGLGQVNTILHELGHGLHGLFSDVKYASMSGTSVVRDFVETPSTFMEYFLRQAWFIKSFAKHYKTGESISDDLVDKIVTSRTFEVAASELGIARYSLLDLRMHTAEHKDITSVKAFEDMIFERNTVRSRQNRGHRSFVFSHLFSGFHSGYSAGYYVYRWAENYAANAFMIFMKDRFSPEVAQRWRQYVLSVGGFGDAVENYLKFSQGQVPDPEAFFKINKIE